jgi:hypothetical protein
MKKNNNSYPEWVKFGLVVMVVIGFSWITASKILLIDQNPVKEEQVQSNPMVAQQPLKIGLSEVMVEVRRTEVEQALGLSWRKNMGENEGMVFLYSTPQKVLDWMKGMQFPLDLVFASDGKVVELISRVTEPTENDPVIRTISPKIPVDMVIEVNAGWVESHQIKVGDEVKL